MIYCILDERETLASQITVTHVLSELKDVNQLSRLYPKLLEHQTVKIVSVQWLHTCVRQKSIVPEESFLIPGFLQWAASKHKNVCSSAHQTSTNDSSNRSEGGKNEYTKFLKNVFNENVLERDAPLEHCNKKLVEPLVFLIEYWTVMGDERRALAYAKAAATLKCLPFTVKSISEVEDLKGLGTGHSLKVIQEVLETGSCQEVSLKTESDKYQILKNLSSVYGIGPSLALRLHSNYAINSVKDLTVQWNQLNLRDERIKVGVAFHADLNDPVPRELAEKIMSIVKSELGSIKEGHLLELAGGFRRGKSSGHDVDLLISYPKDGEEVGVLSRLVKQLKLKGIILQSRFEKSSFDEEAIFRRPSGNITTMDHFEKCFCIFRYPLHSSYLRCEDEDFSKLEFDALVAASQTKRDWKAVRVDLVVIPRSQWAYALLGWTGSKLYMRMLRHYSNTVLNKSLNSHGLWDRQSQRLLSAETEEDVFRHLGLTFKKFVNRNF